MTQTAARQEIPSAEICRRNGWKAGTILRGGESGPGWSYVDTIKITAVGFEYVLARIVYDDGELGHESTWALNCREWKAVN